MERHEATINPIEANTKNDGTTISQVVKILTLFFTLLIVSHQTKVKKETPTTPSAKKTKAITTFKIMIFPPIHYSFTFNEQARKQKTPKQEGV